MFHDPYTEKPLTVRLFGMSARSWKTFEPLCRKIVTFWYLSSGCWKESTKSEASQLGVPKTVYRVIVHHPCCLHEGITDRCTNKLKAPSRQVPTHRVRFLGGYRHLAQCPPRVLNRPAVYELP